MCAIVMRPLFISGELFSADRGSDGLQRHTEVSELYGPHLICRHRADRPPQFPVTTAHGWHQGSNTPLVRLNFLTDSRPIALSDVHPDHSGNVLYISMSRQGRYQQQDT